MSSHSRGPPIEGCALTMSTVHIHSTQVHMFCFQLFTCSDRWCSQSWHKNGDQMSNKCGRPRELYMPLHNCVARALVAKSALQEPAAVLQMCSLPCAGKTLS